MINRKLYKELIEAAKEYGEANNKILSRFDMANVMDDLGLEPDIKIIDKLYKDGYITE